MTAQPLCELCTQGFDKPLNRPDWTKCMACTLNGPGVRRTRKQGATPAYPLPAATLDELTFIVPGKPLSVNRVYRTGAHWYYTREGETYKSSVRAHALAALGPMAHKWDKSRSFTITLIAYFATTRSDSDNIIKPVKDALQDMPKLPGSGVLYANDNQVISDHTEKCLDPTAPRLVVTVKAVP